MYRTLFYVNIYGSYKLSKNSPVFLAHPVYWPVDYWVGLIDEYFTHILSFDWLEASVQHVTTSVVSLLTIRQLGLLNNQQANILINRDAPIV